MSVLNSNNKGPVNLEDNDESISQPATASAGPAGPIKSEPAAPTNPAEVRLKEFATRSGIAGKQGGDTTKMIMLAGGVLVALLFFLFTQFGSKTHKSTTQAQKPSESQKPAAQQATSHVPIMDPVHMSPAEQGGDRISPNDIQRTRKPSSETGGNSADGAGANKPPHPPGTGSRNLASVPPFKDTQQHWENPAPYGSSSEGTAGNTPAAQQAQNALKEASLVYVKSAQQASNNAGSEPTDAEGPVLQLNEGTRISARLETQISSAIHAPVVAVVEYTYAIGNQVLVPAGARVYGKLKQADSSGEVGVDFDEIELLDGAREKITAIGEGLDLGPIRGDVYGRHNGRNFLVRAMSGLGSTATMLVGNNTSAAYSANDMIRQRAAENIGMAGDSQLMMLNANTHITVSVPANTRIYIVWTQRPKSQTPATARPMTQASATPTTATPQ
jgi:type IV secretory pathway VirB10-like protein